MLAAYFYAIIVLSAIVVLFLALMCSMASLPLLNVNGDNIILKGSHIGLSRSTNCKSMGAEYSVMRTPIIDNGALEIYIKFRGI